MCSVELNFSVDKKLLLKIVKKGKAKRILILVLFWKVYIMKLEKFISYEIFSFELGILLLKLFQQRKKSNRNPRKILLHFGL